jgi:hypothetical protein
MVGVRVRVRVGVATNGAGPSALGRKSWLRNSWLGLGLGLGLQPMVPGLQCLNGIHGQDKD